MKYRVYDCLGGELDVIEADDFDDALLQAELLWWPGKRGLLIPVKEPRKRWLDRLREWCHDLYRR